MPFGLISGIQFDVLTETDRVKYILDLISLSATSFLIFFSFILWHTSSHNSRIRLIDIFCNMEHGGGYKFFLVWVHKL